MAIVQVDADAHRSLGDRFGVQGFPTIKFFGRGKPVSEPVDYSGARTSEGFLTYLQVRGQPAAQLHGASDDLQLLLCVTSCNPGAT